MNTAAPGGRFRIHRSAGRPAGCLYADEMRPAGGVALPFSPPGAWLYSEASRPMGVSAVAGAAAALAWLPTTGEFLYAEGEYTAAIEVLRRLPLGIGRRLPLPDAVLPGVDGQLLLGSGPHGDADHYSVAEAVWQKPLRATGSFVCPLKQCCLHSTGAGSGKGPALLCLPSPPRLSDLQTAQTATKVGPSGLS